jgi:hypothetical protein
MDFLARHSNRKRGSNRGLPAIVMVERLERRMLLSLQVGPIAAVAGQTFNGPVATFGPNDLQGTLADFLATINWGGGVTPSSTGTITANAQGGYTVSGSNIYPAPGSYTLNVTVTGANNTSVQGTGPATVSDAPLTTTAVTIQPLLQTSFSGVVASFTSANPYANTSDFSATINWGDGVNTNTPGVISANSSGGFNVVGQFSGYQNAGTFPVTVTIKSPAGQTNVVNSMASVTALPVAVYPIKVTAAVNQSLTGVTVASFVDPYLTDTASDFQASIAWGDGTTSPGTITGGSNGVYTVTGTKTSPYTAAGTYTVTTQVVRTATQQVVSAAGQAVISAVGPTLVPTGVLLVEPAGVTFNDVQVGTFTDSKTGAPSTNFSVEINWDNGQTTPGTATFVSSSGGVSLFSVTGTNVYTTPGTYNVSVTVNDNQGDSTTIASTAVATGPVLTPISALIIATAGQPLPTSTIVGSVLDSNPADTPADLQATINWGDGHTSQGTVTAVAGSPGLFTISGTNLYTTPNTDSISIAVQNDQGQSTTIQSTAVVLSPFLSATGTTFSTTPGVPLPTGTVVANFTDSNLNATAGNIIATINWGDGQSSSGKVNLISSNGSVSTFTVTGTHVYATSGTASSYPVTVSIDDPSGQTATVTSTATVTTPIAASGTTFSVTPGQSFTATIANFTDTNPAANANNITAVINWGDGQTSTGLISGSSGIYTVSGNHTYSAPGAASYAIKVTIVDPSGQSVQASSTAIATAFINATGTTFNAIPGQSFTTTVATFTDSNPNALTHLPTAVINWGDGQSSTVTATFAAGLFTVTGTHTYSAVGALGSYPVTVTILDPSGQTATANSTAITASVFNATGTSFTTTVGQTFTQAVANFTDTNPNATLKNITALINWGDGQSSVGQISSTGVTGGYTVTGTHAYATAGTSGTFPITVTITDPSGQSAVANSTALVAAPTIVATGRTFNAIPSQSFTTTVATFTDSNPNATTNLPTAVIKWGDGQTSTGTVTYAAGVFTVAGSHTYSAPGAASSYPVTVTILDPSGQTATANSTAIIVASFISATGTTFTTTVGQTFTQTVANFTDTNPNATLKNITALINWGDGQSSVGQISSTGVAGGYTVTGTHAYATAGTSGTFPITVMITDPSGQSAVANSTALVAAPTIVATGRTFTVIPGQSFTTTVATFTDSNPNAVTNLPTAVISWGDGQSSSVTATYASGVFTVTGTHAYSAPGASGSYSILVTILDPSGQTATANSTALTSSFINATGTTFTAIPGLPFTATVANFTDSNPNAITNPPTAVITWGDGQSSSVTATYAAGVFTVTGTHTYSAAAATGSYNVLVTILDPSGQTATANSTALIVSPTVSATGITFSATSGEPFSGTVAFFTDSNPSAKTNLPTAVINWGDGQTSPGVVSLVSSTSSQSTFAVMGTHTYSTAGIAATYPVTVTIVDPSGQMASANSTAIVGNPGAPALTGGLTAIITNGPHSASGFTNTNRPTFTGTTAPFAIVQLYARHFNVDAELPLGEAVADGNGHWSLTTGPLAVGTYIVTATVTLPGSYPSGMITLYNQNGTDLVYIDLTPRLVRWLSRGQKSIPHTKVGLPHPRALKPQWVGHHRA